MAKYHYSELSPYCNPLQEVTVHILKTYCHLKGTLAWNFLVKSGFARRKKSLNIYDFVLNLPKYSISACIPHLHSICTDSFCVFLVHKQINCTYSQYRDRLILHIQTFGIFSVNEQSHSTYSQYTNRFILHILSVCTDSFCLFGKHVHRNFEYSEWNYFLRCF